MIPVLFGVSILTFSLTKMLPGSPVDYILQFQETTPGLREQLEAQYNLNEPVYVQYWLWLRDAMVLDFGDSLISDRSVSGAILRRLPKTLLLGGGGFLIAVTIGIPLGVLAAVNNGNTIDEASRVGALLGIATPNFWLGLMLLLVFSVQLGWFRVIPPDMPTLSLPMLKFVILPAITLGTASSALIMRLTRSSMVEELNKDYVRTAKAKGLSERTVIVKHVLRNSMVSVVTVAAIQVAFIVNGSVVIEQVFSWPGVGRMLIQAITQRDLPVLQAIVLMIAVTIVFVNLIADLLYSWLDPRIRY
ncbi:peptide/nickel transport system permease protein [Halolamina salifodinae]|uniref:Peptide/nickel transport system permease protein n=2 Tax=Halolamina salifodinae TaxID=1202767 RepID=A0A8T4GYX7_9EURY|nr:peptide/nickel transport system permease protein [Halolamina salifodinae]